MPIGLKKDGFSLSLAQTDADVRAAQRLRYDVFVEELGAGGSEVDHAARLEKDGFDAHSDHLILREDASGDVVGVYRVLRQDQADAAGGFYSESEFDLSPLKASGRRLLELGRSCLRGDVRGSSAMFHLWTGLSQYVAHYGAEVLFGVASFKGTDPDACAAPLTLLARQHLAPQEIRPRARPYQEMDLVAGRELDRRAAMIALPPLIKAYLRLGGTVGAGAFIDHAFDCIDVCMVMDTDALNARYARHYIAEGAV